jgi:hypothetical protein
MLKKINYTILSFVLLSALIQTSACLNDPKPAQQQTTIDTTSTTTGATSAPLPTPPPDPKVEQKRKELEEKSEFLNLGCCKEKEKRKNEPCCCDLVLEEYKKLRPQIKDPAMLKRIVKMKSSDPIYETCFKKMKKQFEKIDEEIEAKEKEATKKSNPKAKEELDY